MYIILKPKLLQNVKKATKTIPIIILSVALIIAIIFIKYKPIYEVTVFGNKLGYVSNIEEFKSLIEEKIIKQEGKYIVDTSLMEEPTYKKVVLARTTPINEKEIIENLKENDTIITYKYYEVSLNNETKSYVDTIEEAEKIVNEIKSEYSDELNIQINEKYTEKLEEICTDSVEVATNTVETAAKKIKEENEALAIINDVKISVLPVSGRISSRYGEVSRRRASTHTGLDIACSQGTPIKAVSKGTVICASYQGAYGNLVKISHGNGIETWYGHCQKIYVNVGDEVEVGSVIAAVGSTGNSTGPHLHFEIRINGNTVNPQNYVY